MVTERASSPNIHVSYGSFVINADSPRALIEMGHPFPTMINSIRENIIFGPKNISPFASRDATKPQKCPVKLVSIRNFSRNSVLSFKYVLVEML